MKLAETSVLAKNRNLRTCDSCHTYNLLCGTSAKIHLEHTFRVISALFPRSGATTKECYNQTKQQRTHRNLPENKFIKKGVQWCTSVTIFCLKTSIQNGRHSGVFFRFVRDSVSSDIFTRYSLHVILNGIFIVSIFFFLTKSSLFSSMSSIISFFFFV